MGDELRRLYQEVILDHSQHPRNFGRPERPSREARGDNPLCGDRVTVYLDIEDGTVRGVRFEGRGCAISMASASLMTEVLKGKSAAEAEALFERFHALVTGEDESAGIDGDMERLTVFSGVRDFPVRVKCATLPWHTMKAALEGAREPVTTEE